MKNRNWFLTGLLLLLGAALLLREGERRRAREQAAAGTNAAPPAPGLWERLTRRPAAAPAAPAPVPSTAHVKALGDDPRLPFRVRNTAAPAAELFRSETAVLLRNALIETREPVRLNIPPHLRAPGDPGSWLVQARGSIDGKFREVLRGAGAEIVSYVPNNTYLVRASAGVAQQLRVAPRVHSVLPFEPFYKLDMQLLPLAVRQEPMPAGRWLNLVLFHGTQDRAKADLAALGAEVKAEQPFPFGHVVTIAPPAHSLVALAQMPAVQNIEAWHAPVLLNDLSRVRLDVSTNTTDLAPAGNWLGLTGSGVTVALVDSGVDLAHPQLVGRTFVNAFSPAADADGHGTAVAGSIVGTDSTTPTATNGSLAGGTYRGIASGARLYPLSIYATDYTNYGNLWLITNGYLATNIFIVNNSWGYPVSTYDINSALYDEKVRDALDWRTNIQPQTHVFAAGNAGNANSGGLGGAADTIASPGNAKNVISVGSSELFRLVPNSTNDPQANARSDSFSQVSDFSSRGNVGVGIEGTAGRFKPDLIAPGQYIATLRASTFTNPQPADADLGSSQWRYESGTSLAAGKVSGVLALVEEFFRSNFSRTNGLRPSLNKALLINRAQSLGPAYDFAVNNPVTHQGWGIPSVSNTLPSVAGIALLSPAASATAPIVLVEENAFVTNHVASGEYHAFDVSVPAIAGGTNNLKVTLAWTDPPGNPISSVKLVNDLDLYVTNLVANGAQFEGNNIAPGGTVSQPTSPGSLSQRDSVNNVENAFIPLTNTSSATTFRVYVIGRKVNVNAVSGNTNQVAQDYSLVFSTDAAPTNSLTVTFPAATNGYAFTNRPVNIVTNGIPYLNERVGANSPLFTLNGTSNPNTNGLTNQWNFYVFTNQNAPSPTVTNLTTNVTAGVTNITTNIVRLPMVSGGPYVAFSTFLPPNLARARNGDSDIDLYVARDGGPSPVPNAFNLTNLDPAVLSHANTFRSTNRGGYELFSVTNSAIGEVFYVGIKSEDQQGGTYGFFGASAPFPFFGTNTNGYFQVALFPVPMDIPDGTPENPGGVTLYGILPTNVIMQSITMSNVIVHENLGDLVGTLTHNGTVVTLNNHSLGTGTNPPGGLVTNSLIYDSFRNPPDGPGDVTDFLGQDGVGLWIFELYDNTPFQTGAVTYADLYLVPYTNQYSTNPNVFYRTFDLAAGQSYVDFFNIPGYATNLDVDIVGGLAGVPGPASSNGVDILASAPGAGVPTSASYGLGTFDLDNLDTNFPHLRISPISSPPITPGVWNFRILNNSASMLTLTLRYTLGVNLAVTDTSFNYTNAGVALLDEYTTNLLFNVPQDRVIAGLDVGVAIRHPRVSDLVLHLISPSGRKALLFEDRGGGNGVTTADLRANFSENTNYVTFVDVNGSAAGGFLNLGYLLPVKFVPAPYSAVVSPPSLVTNMTNLLFGHGAMASSPHESPGGLAHFGQQLVMAGKVGRGNLPSRLRDGTNDGFVAAYVTPIVTNRFTSNLVITPSTTNLLYLPVTNWTVTNFWPGSLSGYRGGSPLPEQTFFNGVALNVDGVFAVGQTRNYSPPVTLTWSGINTRQAYDIDLGATAGSVRLDHLTDAIHDHIRVQYEGRNLLDYTPAGGTPLREVNTVDFNGSSRFLRVIMNPDADAAVGSTWSNTITIFRSNAVTFAVSDFPILHNGTGPIRPPPATVAPTPGMLSGPQAVALDASNIVYVADTANNRLLKFRQALTLPNSLFTPNAAETNGTYVPITLMPAPHGAPRDGLVGPRGVAVHTNGDLYVADTGNHLIKRFRGDGTHVETWGDFAAGTSGNEDSGVGGFARGRFNGPQGISLGANNVLYVADTGNNRIRTIDLASGLVGTITLPAAFVTASGNLNGPRGVVAVIGTAGGNDVTQLARFGSGVIADVNLYVADTDNHRLVWLQQTAPATWNAFHLAGAVPVPAPVPGPVSGRVDDRISSARFDSPSGITADGAGNLYVTDAGSHLIRRVTPLGDVQTIAGDRVGGASGNVNNDVGGTARFNTPRGLAADRFGTLFVADSVNNSIRIVAPYQTGTPTNAFVTYFPFNGPTNSHIMGAPPVFFSRGITNSVFGTELAGSSPASRDTFNGVATATEYGIAWQATNFLYAVGSAQFSTNTVGNLAAYDRMFLTKFATNGRPIWTYGHLPAASIRPVVNGAGAITALIIDSGGAGYTAAPVVTIHDPLNPVAANRNVAVTVTLTGGSVTAVTAPGLPLAGPFVAPRVYVEAPPSPHMPGHAVAVVNGTNVVAAGYTNISSVPLTTNNLPFLLCLQTNGVLRWATNSGTGGHYNAVAVYGTNIIAAGASYSAAGVAGVAGSNCLIESWTLAGTPLLSTIHIFGAGRPSQLSGLIAIEQLDRAYAVGTVSNNATSCDAFLMEIDLQTLAVISVVTNNITNGLNFGKAITTDGVDLYVAVEGPGDGNRDDRQAAIFRYRAKNFYQPEESLNVFVGDRTWGTRIYYDPFTGLGSLVNDTAWRLQITDTRAGGTNVGGTNGMVLSWSLNFSYAAPSTVPITLPAGVSNPPITLSTGPRYFRVPVPSAATAATNRVTATGPVRVAFHASGVPADGAPGTRQMFSGASTGSFVVSTATNADARLRPGSEYYMAITPMNAGAPVEVSVEVSFDRTELPPQITDLAGGVPVNGLALANGSVTHYAFTVPANASAALFEITAANGNVNLYLRRSNGPASLPGPGGFDHASANPFVGTEQIFLVTNAASAAALTPGVWLLGVHNADNAPVSYTVRATAATGAPYTIVASANGQPHAGVTSPGNAPNTLYQLTVPAGEKGLLFELTGLNGNGDLVVRRNAFPLATAFDFGNPRPGGAPEWVSLRTNASLPSLAGDWYFGVLNPGATHVTYNVMARQSVNGVLLGSAPLQLGRPPGSSMLTGGTGFGFGLGGVPGEKYQVQYRTNIAATNWLVLTNLTAPADGVVSFIHAGALTNKNLYYRILAVP
jgi:sugar lactone lactonase YvrE